MYKVDEKADQIAAEINAIELDVLTNYRLSDAIREGAQYTKQAAGWGDGLHTACAMTSAFTAARARGYIE